jgi:hypothetical protein
MENREKLEQLFNIVVQPDHARKVLQELQTKHGYDTVEFLRLYQDGFDLNIPARDVNKWLFQVKLFTTTDGDLGELVNDFFKASTEQENLFFPLDMNADSFLREQLPYGQVQQIEEEAIKASSSIYYDYRVKLV